LKGMIEKYKSDFEIGTMLQSWNTMKIETNAIADNRLQLCDNIEKSD